MYQACATALMKGTPVGELYANGREFCLSRRFQINDMFNSSSCFSDDDLVIGSKHMKIGDLTAFANASRRYSVIVIVYLVSMCRCIIT
jgi:hypothetical protein